jgi:chromosome segregation ATPase
MSDELNVGESKPEAGPSCNFDESLEINELRGSLDRRNLLLDVIRKAYHRDVLVVKEFLLDARLKGLIANVDMAVPSIDLRETFRLFAPEGCELRIRPCWTCGGQLEVIHRESARIVDLKRSVQLLEEKEAHLRMELVDVKAKALEDSTRLADLMQKRKEEGDVLMEKILSLKRQVADRNELDAEARELKIDKRNLEITIESHEPILLDHERLTGEVKAIRDASMQWEAKFHDQLDRNKQLESERESLSHQMSLLGHHNKQLQLNHLEAHDRCQKLDDQCSTLTQNLAKSKAEAKSLEACLRKVKQSFDDMKSEVQQQKQELFSKKCYLESKCSDLESTNRGLRDESKKKSEEAACHGKFIKTVLEYARSKGLIPFVPQDIDAALAKIDELVCLAETLRQKSSLLFCVLTRCIRSTYENCLVQESILVKNGSVLHLNERKLNTSFEPINDKVRNMLEHLESKDESVVIDWSSVLVDETDQRHVIGNLQNRLQMGYFSLDKAFQKIQTAHATEMHKFQEDHQKQLENRRLRIWDLEKMLQESIHSNRKYEDKMLEMQDKHGTVEKNLDAVRCTLRKLRHEYLSNHDTLLMLKDDQERMKTTVNRLVAELMASKALIRAQQANLAEQEDGISHRDAAIAQLESILEQITTKYAENELNRIKVTYEVAAQAAPMVADAASHADVLPSLPDLLALRPHEACDALLPGRIINVDLENWPSRINLSATKPGLQYRRALDKL